MSVVFVTCHKIIISNHFFSKILGAMKTNYKMFYTRVEKMKNGTYLI